MPDMHELKDVVTDEISLVETPAVPEAEFVVLHKSDDNDEDDVYEPMDKEGGYKPTESMIANAKRALEWRDEFNRGGTEVGVARARDISNGKELSLDTVKRMVSYFARHEVDGNATGFNSGEDGFPSAGRIAWDLWGGDSGKTWANEIAQREVKKEDEMPDDVEKREFTPEQRENAAEEGNAMPDGSYPIMNRSDLENAIQAFGRAKDPKAVKAHIKRRAKELGLEELIPESWLSKECDEDMEEYDENEMDKACGYAERHKGCMSNDIKKRFIDMALEWADEIEKSAEVEVKLDKSLESLIEAKVEAILKAKETPVAEESTEIEKAATEPVEGEDTIAKAARLFAERAESARIAKEEAARASLNDALYGLLNEVKSLRQGHEELRSQLDHEMGRA